MKPTRILGAAMLAVLLGGCGDEAAGPGDSGGSTGTLSITTASTGSQPNPDGYTYRIDGGADVAISANDTATLDLRAGTHVISLTGVAKNCTIVEGVSQSVIVTEGQTSSLQFTVLCAAQLDDQIVFSSNRSGAFELWKMNPDGSGVSQLTTVGDAREPAVAPDGKTVAYVLNGTEIWAMDADGANRRLLTSPGTSPSWSPDGAQLAFQSARSGDLDVWVVNADGTGATNLTRSAATEDSQPAWSPDGASIVYVLDNGARKALHVMGANGSNAAALLPTVAGDETDPSWSPDGAHLAYAGTRCRPVDSIPCGDNEIHVVQANGMNDLFRTGNFAEDVRPTWSGDGQRIAYNSDESGNQEIIVMNADGTGDVNVTGHAMTDRVYPQSWARAQ